MYRQDHTPGENTIEQDVVSPLYSFSKSIKLCIDSLYVSTPPYTSSFLDNNRRITWFKNHQEYFYSKMEALYAIPFSVLEVPNLKIKRPSWFHQPSAMVVFAFVLLSYFMVTGGLS